MKKQKRAPSIMQKLDAMVAYAEGKKSSVRVSDIAEIRTILCDIIARAVYDGTNMNIVNALIADIRKRVAKMEAADKKKCKKESKK